MRSLQQTFYDTFLAVGITINGDKPWDMQVHNPKLYNRIIGGGSIGFGEAYMEGWWDCEALDELFFRIQYYRLDKKLPRDLNTLFYFLKAKYQNRQSKDRAKDVIHKHYNLGNELFKKMPDKHMMYSCGNWATA